MATKTTGEQSERKRLTIPKVDQSVLEWWNLQHDPALSIRMLIRAEIERNGYADTAYQPVAQQPRRGRPAGSTTDTDEGEVEQTPPAAATAAPVQVAPEVATPEPAPIPVAAPAGPSAIDALMNG